MSDTTGLEERVVELEVKVAYQDRLIADLDAVIRDFTGRVESLTRQLEQVKELALGGGSDDIGPADEKPPHY